MDGIVARIFSSLLGWIIRYGNLFMVAVVGVRPHPIYNFIVMQFFDSGLVSLLVVLANQHVSFSLGSPFAYHSHILSR